MGRANAPSPCAGAAGPYVKGPGGPGGPQRTQNIGGGHGPGPWHGHGHGQMRIGIGIGIGICKKGSIAIQPKKGLIARAI